MTSEALGSELLFGFSESPIPLKVQGFSSSRFLNNQVLIRFKVSPHPPPVAVQGFTVLDFGTVSALGPVGGRWRSGHVLFSCGVEKPESLKGVGC